MPATLARVSTTEFVSARAPITTVVEVSYPAHRGRLGLRGSRDPLSWERTLEPARVEGDTHYFEFEMAPGGVAEVKVVRNEEDWAGGRNYALHAGERLHIEPFFEQKHPRLVSEEPLALEDGPAPVEVLLPAGYDEQESKRYAVLYTLDGQSLWTASNDPCGVWGFDATLWQLDELAVVAELIVVAVHTAERRLERLSPVPDAQHGGGGAENLLAAITGPLRERINARYRTRTEREHTAVMGASMGGLFAFYAAWTRPDVFGKAACLSSSFWWADRWAVRWALERGAPENPPQLYLDSGAALSPVERDANVRDGFHHTRAMFRALVELGMQPGVNVHRLAFVGATHDAASWAARLAIPLQLLFPREVRVPGSTEG